VAVIQKLLAAGEERKREAIGKCSSDSRRVSTCDMSSYSSIVDDEELIYGYSRGLTGV
jgi:hypothetical protein